MLLKTINTPRSFGLTAVRLMLLLAVTVGTALSVAPAHAQTNQLAEAKQVYQAGDFDRAAALFTEAYEAPSVTEDERIEALHYLGRVYIAQNEYGRAREAVEELVAYGPPIIELDPDIEAPPLMNIYYEVRTEADGFEVQKQDPGMKTLAIMDFTNSSVDDFERLEPLEQGFASMMINQLSGATDLKVVERERIQWLLQELGMQRDADVVDQSTAVRAGKLMGADAALFGAFTMHGKQMWLSARMVSVETGEVLLAEQVMGDADEFFEALEDLSMKVAQAISVTLDETQLGMNTDTRSLDAVLAYSNGLKLLEQNDYRAAYEKFNEALSYDPNYERARLKAESLTPVLAAR